MTGRAVRQSIAPTYDSAVTGPRYRVTTTVAGRTVGEFRRPIPDPFACTRVRVGFRDLIRGLLRGSLEVVVQVSGADRGIEDDVLELDAQTLVPGSTRRQDFDGSVTHRADRPGLTVCRADVDEEAAGLLGRLLADMGEALAADLGADPASVRIGPVDMGRG